MQKRTEAEWWELAADYRGSGLGQKEWCKAKGVNLYTFRDRLSRLRKSESETDKNEELKTVQTKKVNWLAVTEEAMPKESEIKISVSGFEISVTRGFDESMLLKVCRTLVKLC